MNGCTFRLFLEYIGEQYVRHIFYSSHWCLSPRDRAQFIAFFPKAPATLASPLAFLCVRASCAMRSFSRRFHEVSTWCSTILRLAGGVSSWLARDRGPLHAEAAALWQAAVGSLSVPAAVNNLNSDIPSRRCSLYSLAWYAIVGLAPVARSARIGPAVALLSPELTVRFAGLGPDGTRWSAEARANLCESSESGPCPPRPVVVPAEG